RRPRRRGCARGSPLCAALVERQRRRHDRVRRRLLRAQQRCRSTRRAAGRGRARWQPRRGGDDPAPVQRERRHRTGIRHDREDRHLMAVLVTGGCGYTGTRLTQALLARTNQDVVVVDTAWFGNYLTPHPRLTVRTGDVRAAETIDLTGVDTLFHPAGIPNGPAVDLNRVLSWEVNVLATMRLVDRAARHGVRQFIFPSSGAVYGVRKEARITEDLELMPISDYNKTKMVAERVVLSY